MSRLADLIEELCPDGVEYTPLGEVGEFVRGSGLQKSDFVDEGLPCVHYGQIHTRFGIAADEAVANISAMQFHRLKHANHGDLLIATTSENDEAVGKATVWLGHEEVAIGGDMFIFRHVLEPKYVSYFFASSLFGDQKRPYITGTKVKRISEKGLSRIRIPVPPLEVQCEIVRILDQFTTLEAELEARRAQYEYYRNQLLSYDALASRGPVKWVKLGEVASKIITGVTPKAADPKYYQDATNPWIRTQDVNFCRINEASAFVTDQAIAELPLKWVSPHSVVVAISGASAGRSAILNIRAVTNQHCCNIEINSKLADFRYVYYCIASCYEQLRNLGRGARGDLNVSIIKSFEIPLPALYEQRYIADILDRFDTLVNDISSGLPAEIAARRAQYEYYRDRLLSFPEKK
jgi:type I restriction-modification system specificity determinant